jgi:predicted ribosomally synthesized peptide with nif11-like leader
MSVATVRRFYERVADDKELQVKLNALHGTPGAGREAAVSELVAVAAAAGYDFTAADLVQAVDARPRRLSGTELRTRVMAEDCWEGKNYFCNATYICNSTYH